MRYLVTYVVTYPGGMHDHHNFENTYAYFSNPPTEKEISELKQKLSQQSHEGKVVFINFQPVN